MAKLTNLHLFDFAHFDTSVKGKPVGNNRTVTHTHDTSGRRVIAGSLHGHAIVTLKRLKDGVRVTLDPCGHMTATTIAAMTDFMRAAGLPYAKASRAGGYLSLRIGKHAELFTARQGNHPMPVDVDIWHDDESVFYDPAGWTMRGDLWKPGRAVA